ncbi:MAG: hypothetical protein K0M40_00195 [Prolixibacteraceae bacterium]|nr:hypothetical protein [Prolixibacteraceae bacterium]
MKTILKVTLMFAFVAFVNTLFAVGNLKVNIIPLSAEKAVVAISSLTDANLKISVTDDMGRLVYYKETTEPGDNYRKVYNFSDLEDGKYNLSVVSDNLTTERQFEIGNKTIAVGEEKTMLEPFFTYEDGYLKFSYLNFNKENVSLYFFDKNDLVYSKKIGRDFNVNSALNLSKLREGNYVAIIAAGGKEYRYPIDIR